MGSETWLSFVTIVTLRFTENKFYFFLELYGVVIPSDLLPLDFVLEVIPFRFHSIIP